MPNSFYTSPVYITKNKKSKNGKKKKRKEKINTPSSPSPFLHIIYTQHKLGD